VALPARRPQLEVVPLGHDELVVVAPPGHPIARRARCPLAALDGQPFIGFDLDIPTRRLVDGLLRRHRVRVSYTMELDNVETIKRSVEAGLGLSLLPAPTLASEIRARTLVARPPLEGPFRRAIGVIYRRSRELSAAGQAFLALLTAELGARGAAPRR
jgi:DNA-binding transcriptional LysR family regulator